MLVATVVLAAGLVALPPAPRAEAGPTDFEPLSLSTLRTTETLPVYAADFKAANLISDGNFYNGLALSEGQVQAFLAEQVPTCATGSTCLRSFRESTPNRSADGVCAAYAGAVQETAARIIAKVGLACGISQQVLLVLLQKEQKLITSAAPTRALFDKAVGYECPDTGTCNPEYAGFFRQLYGAARQLKFYGSPENTTLTYFPVGVPSNIKYSSKDALGCASPSVTIENTATAALYYYTPYQPNPAALKPANFFLTGDECSEYGNRNFWAIYNGWFGSSIIDRFSGPDRFDASAAISRANFSPDLPTVYVTNGFNFPDALSGAPVAAKDGAPILLVAPGDIPAAIAGELTRLAPGRIVILGGPASVGPAVEAALAPFTTTGEVARLWGADRFDASAAIAVENFPADIGVVYVANGLTFPDALSGAPVAGRDGTPVLLVNADAIPSSIAAALSQLAPQKIVILGGPASVNKDVQTALSAFTAGGVTRLSGADRFDASAEISRKNFLAPVPVVYIANGLKFPDALSGAPVAGKAGAPVLLVTTDGIPPAVAVELTRLDPERIVILGGAASVSAAVSGQLNAFLR